MLKLLARLSNGVNEKDMPSRKEPLLQFSQGELARFIGITRERVNAVLHDLEREEVIKIRHRAVRINRGNLERVLVERGLAERVGVFE